MSSTVIKDVPDLKTIGGQVANAPPLWNSLGTQNATGTVANRPNNFVGGKDTPGFLILYVNGPLAGDITITFPAAVGGGGYRAGDVVRILRTDTASAHSVTVSDSTGGPLSAIGQPNVPGAWVDVQKRYPNGNGWELIGATPKIA